MIKWFLPLLLLTSCCIYWFVCMLNHPCMPAMKPTLSWWMILLICCWIHFAIIYWWFFHQCSLRRLACSSPSWMCSWSLWGWVWYWLHRMNWEVFLPLLFHGKV
jgi:hypothetical protein